MTDMNNSDPAIEHRADPHGARRSRRLARGEAPDEGDLAEREFLTPSQAERHSHTLGMPMARATLDKGRCAGGGPPFTRFGRKILYPRQAFEDWLRSRLTTLVRSTSEYEPGVICGGRPRKGGARVAEPVRSTSEYEPGGGRSRKTGARTAEEAAAYSWD